MLFPHSQCTLTLFLRYLTTALFHGTLSPHPPDSLPRIDSRRIMLAGYSLGGNVALHAGTLTDPLTKVL